MGDALDKAAKKEVMKDIILQLHRGLPAEDAKQQFEDKVGSISSTEIAELEQSLINEGLSTDEIKKFCNVHALIFQSALERVGSEETFPSHPVYLFRLENREIERLTQPLKEIVKEGPAGDLADLRQTLEESLGKLRGIDVHYERKEHLLFPFLEKRGFLGPSTVMWGKDNEIRDLLAKALTDLPGVSDRQQLDAYASGTLAPLLEEIEGMIFKEEQILLPVALEKLQPGDWVESLREALLEQPVIRDNAISMPSGMLGPAELMALLNTLPVDLTFVDKDDAVKYFTEGKERIFRRTRSVIGREVRNCHPPQSVDTVVKILDSFKEGKRDVFDFWINRGGRMIYIRYFAVRDREGQYLGTLEVSQDITEIRKLEGERRLLAESD